MDTLNFDSPYEKQPSEQETIRIDLTQIAGSLPISGYVLSAAVITVWDQTGTEVTSSMIQGTPVVDGPNSCVYPTVKAGSDGQNYFMRIRHTWQKTANPDQTKESDLLIQVRQKGF